MKLSKILSIIVEAKTSKKKKRKKNRYKDEYFWGGFGLRSMRSDLNGDKESQPEGESAPEGVGEGS